MKHPASLDDFPIGCTVKIVGPIPEEKRWFLDDYLGEIGTVMSRDVGGSSVVVGFGPCVEPNGIVVEIAWLERGHIEWIPDEVSA